MKKKKILIFAGTTEGRQIAEYAWKNGIPCMVSVATEYGGELLEEDFKSEDGTERKELQSGDMPRVICGRMDRQEMEAFLEKEQVGLAIDATHPFAVVVTENIRQACENCKIKYLRCLREQLEYFEENGVVCVTSVDEAVDYLENTEGNILITTGSKELGKYTRLTDYKERCYARVLSVLSSVEQSIGFGFSGNHLIAMQGPFSEEMNLALLHQTKAAYFVTKESGKNGGFEEKQRAAEKAGAKLVVIGRPKEQGFGVEEICQKISRQIQTEGEKEWNVD